MSSSPASEATPKSVKPLRFQSDLASMVLYGCLHMHGNQSGSKPKPIRRPIDVRNDRLRSPPLPAPQCGGWICRSRSLLEGCSHLIVEADMTSLDVEFSDVGGEYGDRDVPGLPAMQGTGQRGEIEANVKSTKS